MVTLQEKAGVGPHDTLRLPFDIEIAKDEKPQIGDWLILASVTLTRGEGGFERRGIAVVEHKVQVSVPGVSDVLKVLDLPSLLLVPGALVLATWSLLFRAGETANSKWLEWKNSSFWLVSITVSLFIFGTLSQLRTGPNFLVAFSVRDVALLWLACVFLGVVTFVLYRVARKSWAAYSAGRAEPERRAREPLQSDKPIDILRKLERAHLRLYLPSHTRTVAGQAQQIFKLDIPASEGKAWVVPQMMLRQRAQEESAEDGLAR